MERMTGIEPAFTAWRAVILPLNYIRIKWTLSLFAKLVNFFSASDSIFSAGGRR